MTIARPLNPLASPTLPLPLALLLLCLFLLLTAGCGLMPKRVEYFQDKVKAVPEQTQKSIELQKEAALYVAQQVDVARVAAAAESSSPAVQTPLAKAEPVADALSASLGAPEKARKVEDPAETLTAPLQRQDARLDARLDAYRASVEPNVGKKIEGTGGIQLGYFTNLLIIGGGIAFILFAIKVLGMVFPQVGIPAGVIGGFAGRVSSSLLSKGFTEVLKGGEKFKKLVDEKLAPEAAAQVRELFRTTHEGAQSSEVQDVIRALTSKK